MTNNIYPPDHLLKKWESLIIDEEQNVDVVLYEAFQAGADQELEACCDSLQELWAPSDLITSLRAARRPKPPEAAKLEGAGACRAGTVERRCQCSRSWF